jgi:hypothetical protein
MNHSRARVGLLVVIYFITLVACFGCARARSDLTSVKHSSEMKPFSQIAVGVKGDDVTINAKIEHEFANQLSKEGVICLPLTDIVLTERITDAEKLKEIILEKGVDGVLIVQITATGEKQIYIPPSGYSYGYGSGQSYGYGNLMQGFNYQGQSQYSGGSFYRGGHFISKPWAQCNLMLMDASNGKIVWTGLSVTSGKSRANLEDFVKAGVTEAVKKLKEDGVIKTR